MNLFHRPPTGARTTWRDVRVAEGARLESVCTGNRIEGSNPSLSANRPGGLQRGIGLTMDRARGYHPRLNDKTPIGRARRGASGAL